MIKRCGKIRKSYILYAVTAIVVVLLNVIAWNSTAFCDAYIRYIFPIWVNTYGRFMDLFSFSVGEIMLFLGAALAAIFLLMLPVAGVVKMVDMVHRGRCAIKNCRRTAATERVGSPLGPAGVQDVAAGVQDVPAVVKDGAAAVRPDVADTQPGTVPTQAPRSLVWRIVKYYMTFFVWLVLIVCVIMTLNCTILYHASTFSEKYFGESATEYTLEDLITVRNLVVEKCNELSAQMERDDRGYILYDKDIRKAAVEAMQQLGEDYDQLDGYYPYPKPLATSDFFSQQYMCGYYFPFSMEANYNDVMYIMNKHSTMCHELAHLRGYIFEDEANFISYLACIQSEDIVMQYSGYLSVLNYLDNDYYKSIGKDWDTYISQPRILDQVHDDNIFLTQEEWDRIEDKAVLDTETVDEVSDAFTETTLKVNGVSDGMLSYSRVVKLLLQYYEAEGILHVK